MSLYLTRAVPTLLYLFTFKNDPCFVTLPPPTLAARKAKLVHAIWLHLDTVSRFFWCHVVPATTVNMLSIIAVKKLEILTRP
jgi:hypothetical protein